jgi:hypothetical protein
MSGLVGVVGRLAVAARMTSTQRREQLGTATLGAPPSRTKLGAVVGELVVGEVVEVVAHHAASAPRRRSFDFRAASRAPILNTGRFPVAARWYVRRTSAGPSLPKMNFAIGRAPRSRSSARVGVASFLTVEILFRLSRTATVTLLFCRQWQY